ncbi:MAG: MGMT family protein [Deltaproteobacteria bacterium]|nr:MGMT family protein [Deltaproteobacteria bacterium]
MAGNLEGGFRERVAAAVRRVPAGRVTTYGDVAGIIGNPGAARQVGWALSALPADTDVPWHRVINRQGTLSLRGDLLRGDAQRRRLEAEGQVFDEAGRLDLGAVRWRWDDAPS